jgi:ABC-type sugar transport system permease subunit
MTRRGRAARSIEATESRLAWGLVLPALAVVGLIALAPIAWTAWESLHLHDLRMPWRGRPFIGLGNYVELLGDARFRGALQHTAAFAALSVPLELLLGLALALALHGVFRGRGAVRALVLLPWAIPTVVTGLIWRVLFEAPASPLSRLAELLAGASSGGPGGGPAGGGAGAIFAHPIAAWIPIVLADVWKTTPFVTLLLLAGLQMIDGTLYEAARIDGAGAWGRLIHITLPALRPAILVALVFRTLDALRVFDLIYVMTAGGPGTATEPLALYTFGALLQDLRFGYGAALSVVVFALAFALALLFVRLLGAPAAAARRPAS